MSTQTAAAHVESCKGRELGVSATLAATHCEWHHPSLQCQRPCQPSWYWQRLSAVRLRSLIAVLGLYNKDVGALEGGDDPGRVFIKRESMRASVCTVSLLNLKGCSDENPMDHGWNLFIFTAVLGLVMILPLMFTLLGWFGTSMEADTAMEAGTSMEVTKEADTAMLQQMQIQLTALRVPTTFQCQRLLAHARWQFSLALEALTRAFPFWVVWMKAECLLQHVFWVACPWKQLVTWGHDYMDVRALRQEAKQCNHGPV